MKICIASFWSDAMEPLATMTWENKVRYARGRGYSLLSGKHHPYSDIMWDRPRKWADVLNQAEDGTWCLFLGCDTLFTRTDRGVESWIDDSQDAHLLIDHATVFGDCHLWKASAKTRTYMRAIADRTNHQGITEQDAFTTTLTGRDLVTYRSEAGTQYGEPDYYVKANALLNNGGIKVKLLNCTNFIGDDPANWPPGGIPPHHAWTREHLLLHMGGLPNHQRLDILPRYLS